MRSKDARDDILARLRDRRSEIEQAVLARVNAIADPERNVSSAAAALGVSRNTVASRLRTVEERRSTNP